MFWKFSVFGSCQQQPGNYLNSRSETWEEMPCWKESPTHWLVEVNAPAIVKGGNKLREEGAPVRFHVTRSNFFSLVKYKGDLLCSWHEVLLTSHFCRFCESFILLALTVSVSPCYSGQVPVHRDMQDIISVGRTCSHDTHLFAFHTDLSSSTHKRH